MSGTGRVHGPDPGRAAQYDRLHWVYAGVDPALRDSFSKLREVLHEFGDRPQAKPPNVRPAARAPEDV